MRDWPLLLVTAAFFMGSAARYIAEGGADNFAAMLACLGSAAFGAWLYSLGQQAAESIRDAARAAVARERE